MHERSERVESPGTYITMSSKSKSKSYDLLRMEIYIEHKIFCQLKHDQD